MCLRLAQMPDGVPLHRPEVLYSACEEYRPLFKKKMPICRLANIALYRSISCIFSRTFSINKAVKPPTSYARIDYLIMVAIG